MNIGAIVHGLGYHPPELRPDQMQHQQTINFRPADPRVHPDAHARLSRQCALILAAFQSAPDHTLTNAQLAEIAIRYSARLFDIRKAGIAIFEKVKVDHASGLVTYKIVPVATEVTQ